MKKLILYMLFLLPTLFVSGNEKPLVYGGVSSMGAYPLVGAGMRAQKGKHAVDLSGGVLPKSGTRTFHAKGQYLLFPFEEGLYLGTGLGVLNEPETLERVTGSVEGTLGYQWKTSTKTRVFLEANGMMPFDKPGGDTARVWPGISLGMGF